MRNFDYSSSCYYFITICTWNKACIFGKPGVLNAWGITADSVLTEIEKHFSHVKVDKYVIMPNHVHMILALENSTADVSTIIGQYKSSVT